MSEPVSSGRRQRWHVLYYVLAAINVLTILGSLYLNHSVMGIYRRSVEVNQDWTQHLSDLMELGTLAQAAGAPGNDIFDSRDVGKETARRDAALDAFETRMTGVKRDLLNDPAGETKPLLASLDKIQEAMDEMMTKTDLIFIYFRANDAAQAGRYMATMNRAFAMLMQEIANAQRLVQDHQNAQFQTQIKEAGQLGRFEYLIGVVIVLIVIFVVFYGAHMAKVMKAAEAERQQLIAKLKKSKAKAQGRLADAIESLNGGFVLYDAEDRLVMCNQIYRDMYPQTADLNVVGTTFEDLIRADVERGQVPEAVGREEEWLAERLHSHRAAENTSEQELGDGRWILVSERRTTEGGVVGIRTDITARKKTELELRKTLEDLHAATDKLAKQERLSMLGQVAGTVSHELRNPLGAIRNSMALLRQITAGKGLGAERALDRIDRNVERCTRIIGDLLDFTRSRELVREATAIDAWLGETLDEMTLVDRVSLRRELTSGGEVAFDRERFRQVIVNLVDNAAQALTDPAWSPPDDRQRTITVRTETAGPHLRLSIIDNGPGIPADRLPKIFEPLFTTKSFGVGLGLPTVRQIVEQHGGTIDVESTIDEGTAFILWLPRQAGETAGGNPVPARALAG